MRTGKILKCKTCGKDVYVEPNRLYLNNHYCNIDCFKKYKIVECAYCHKKIRRPGMRIKERNYCNTSHQLRYEYENNLRQKKPCNKLYEKHKEKCSGSNYWNWKGGKTNHKLKYYDQYYSVNWQRLRLSIYERDNWTCRICGNHCEGKKSNNYKNRIQCHHIIPYRISQDNSSENLITLCARCHKNEEYKYYAQLKPVREE